MQDRDEAARVGVAEREDAGHDLLARAGTRRDGRLAGLADRHDLGEAPTRHGGEALHLEHRLEDEVRLVRGDAGGRDDRDLPPHAVVDDEVPPRHLTHELREDGELHVLEVEGDHRLLLRGLLLRGLGFRGLFLGGPD